MDVCGPIALASVANTGQRGGVGALGRSTRAAALMRPAVSERLWSGGAFGEQRFEAVLKRCGSPPRASPTTAPTTLGARDADGRHVGT
eukprot:4939278-Prymnesium_polylepis.1